MGMFEITTADGTKYRVESDSVEQAHKDLAAHRQQEMNQKFADEAKDKSFMAAAIPAITDVGRVGLDTLTAGYGDKFANYMGGTDDEAIKTAAARNRMGWAGTGLEATMLARFLPSLAAKTVGAVGGGPAVRTAVGTGMAAGEGAAHGAVSAAGHDQDVGSGAVTGGVMGVLGKTVGDVANAGTRKFNELFRGKVYEPPKYNVTQLPKNFDTLSKQKQRVAEVNLATSNAERAGVSSGPIGQQSAIINEFKGLDPKLYTPNQRAELDRIIKGDLGTKASKTIGNYVGDKFIAAGAGAGAGFASGNVLDSLLTAGGVSVLGDLIKRGSLGGTKEAAQNLRRMVYGTPQFKGPVSEIEKQRFAKMARQLGIEAGLDE